MKQSDRDLITMTANDVVNFLIEKLIYRHPHIYSDTKVKGEDDVKKNWEKLKLQKSDKGLLDGVPKNLPTLIKRFFQTN